MMIDFDVSKLFVYFGQVARNDYFQFYTTLLKNFAMCTQVNSSMMLVTLMYCLISELLNFEIFP